MQKNVYFLGFFVKSIYLWGKQDMEDKIRHFGGKLFVPKDGKVRTPANIMERNFEKKHLKAYLRGDKKFSFGRDAHGDTAWYFVNEIWL